MAKITWGGILKIQRPLVPPNSGELLFYNEDRSIYQQVEHSQDDILRIFPNDELRVYWRAVLRDNGTMTMVEPAEPEGW